MFSAGGRLDVVHDSLIAAHTASGGWKGKQMSGDRGYLAVAALKMARMNKYLAEKYAYGDLALTAIRLERRATAAIEAGKSHLPPIVGGEIITTPEQYRQLAKLMRLHAGRPGYLSKEDAERFATDYERLARIREGRTILAKAGGSITDHESPSIVAGLPGVRKPTPLPPARSQRKPAAGQLRFRGF